MLFYYVHELSLNVQRSARARTTTSRSSFSSILYTFLVVLRASLCKLISSVLAKAAVQELNLERESVYVKCCVQSGRSNESCDEMPSGKSLYNFLLMKLSIQYIIIEYHYFNDV